MPNIASLYNHGRPIISVELTPPRVDNPVAAFDAAMVPLVPFVDYVSVTNGAGGSARGGTIDLCARAQDAHGLPAMPHLSCRWLSPAEVEYFAMDARSVGLESILALRGDPPRNGDPSSRHPQSYPHADGLVDHLAHFRSRLYASPRDFGIAVACYPEGHPRARSFDDDVSRFKHKADLGADFAITQMVFDAGVYRRFVDRCRQEGIALPIVPGIFVLRSPADLVNLPRRFGVTIPAANPSAQRFDEWRAGYLVRLCEELLASGAPGLHFFSMNNTEAVRDVAQQVRR